MRAWSGEGHLQGFRILVSSQNGMTRDLSGAPFIRVASPFRKLPPHDLSTSKAPPTSTITSNTRINICFLGGYKHSHHSRKYNGCRAGWARQMFTIIPCIYQYSFILGDQLLFPMYKNNLSK